MVLSTEVAADSWHSSESSDPDQFDHSRPAAPVNERFGMNKLCPPIFWLSEQTDFEIYAFIQHYIEHNNRLGWARLMWRRARAAQSCRPTRRDWGGGGARRGGGAGQGPRLCLLHSRADIRIISIGLLRFNQKLIWGSVGSVPLAQSGVLMMFAYLNTNKNRHNWVEKGDGLLKQRLWYCNWHCRKVLILLQRGGNNHNPSPQLAGRF